MAQRRLTKKGRLPQFEKETDKHKRMSRGSFAIGVAFTLGVLLSKIAGDDVLELLILPFMFFALSIYYKTKSLKD